MTGGLDVLPLVLRDPEERAVAGRRKYGVGLQTFNGRDSLTDAYQEALDLCMYLRQAIEERNSTILNYTYTLVSTWPTP